MNARTHAEDRTPDRSAGLEKNRLERFLDASPGVRDAIRQRVSEYPEYRGWLQQFGTGLLNAVE